MSKLASLIAKREGFGIPGAIPTVRNNPGDLRHSPHSTHPADDPNGIGYIDTPEHGWEDLERQLGLYAERGLTLAQAVYEFAPPSENDSAGYLSFVCNGLGCPPSTPVTQALAIAGSLQRGGRMNTTISAAKIGAVAAGTYAGTLVVGLLNYLMTIQMPDKYSQAVIGLCVIGAVHFLKDNPNG